MIKVLFFVYRRYFIAKRLKIENSNLTLRISALESLNQTTSVPTETVLKKVSVHSQTLSVNQKKKILILLFQLIY